MEMFETLTGLASRDPPTGKLTKIFLAFHVICAGVVMLTGTFFFGCSMARNAFEWQE